MKKFIAPLLVLAALVIVPAVDLAFAAGDEPGEYLDRRVVIWNLFYRLMTVAFTVGAVVSGTMIWQCGGLGNLIQRQNLLLMRELTGRNGWTF